MTRWITVDQPTRQPERRHMPRRVMDSGINRAEQAIAITFATVAIVAVLAASVVVYGMWQLIGSIGGGM